MLAVVKTKSEPGIEIADQPEPKISHANEVLVRVAACSICGSDLHLYEWHPEAFPNLTLPRILGHEVAGTVVQVGRDVTDLKPGDRIVADPAGGCGFCYYCRRGLFNLCDYRVANRIGIERHGGFAQFVVTTFFSLFKVPDTIPFEQAAVLEPLGVAVHAVERSHLKPGDYVVILGPGPLGFMGTMMVQVNGASKVVVAGLDVDRDRLQLVAELGADTVDLSKQKLGEKVLNETDGRGADVVFDFAGGSKSLTEAISVARKGGEVILSGLGPKGEVSPVEIVTKELTILGSFARQPSTWNRTIALAASGKINLTKVITHVLPLQKAEEGFQILLNRKGLKVVLIP